MRIKGKRLNGKELFFTSDEHFNHYKIIEYCARPFESTKEMDETLISNFNRTVPKNGFTIHGGDFYLGRGKFVDVKREYIDRLNGEHIFLNGSHDHWLPQERYHEMVETRVDGRLIVVCHYAMRVWPASHYNSWLLYGHSHGGLPSFGKSYDIGVDNNEYLPVSYEYIKDVMHHLEDNFNLVPNRRY